MPQILFIMPKRSWKPSVCTLPESVYKALSESFTGHEYDKAVLLTYRVYSKYLQNELSLSESYNIPSDYYRKVLGTAYRSIFIKLVKLGVFVKTKNYGVNQGIANHYCFGIEHQESPPIWVNYAATHRRPAQFEELVIKQLNKITILEGHTPETIIEELLPIHMEAITSRIDVEKKIYKNKKDKETRIDGDINEFKISKINLLQKIDYDILVRIRERNFAPSRNKTNARLDHILTNSSNRIIKYLRYNGERIISADLGSSQFCLLSNIILQTMKRTLNQVNYDNENLSVLQECLDRLRNEKSEMFITTKLKISSYRDEEDSSTRIENAGVIINKVRDTKDCNTIACITVRFNTDDSKLNNVFTENNANDYNTLESNSDVSNMKATDTESNTNDINTSVNSTEAYNTYKCDTRVNNTEICDTDFVYINELIPKRIKSYEFTTTSLDPMMRDLKKYKNTISQQNVNDLVPFFKSSIDGRLYQEISVMLGLADRDEGKKACFELLFGRMVSEGQIRIESAADIPSRGRLFREAFPNVFELVNSFKQHHVRLQGQVRHKVKKGSRIFPIFLQQMESFIFIDNILPTLLEKNIDCVTKHDSFLFPASQYQAAIDIVFNEMKKFLPFGFTLKIEQDGAGVDIKKYIIPEIEIENEVNQYFGTTKEFYKENKIVDKIHLPYNIVKLIELALKRRDAI